jgi:DNA polymerase-4
VFVSNCSAILHADADAFFASVEQRDDPSLRGRPVAVGGGVVMAASYEARRYGVRGAMGGAQARRLCPHLVVVSPRFDAYVQASKALFRVFDDHAPRVEGISLEEAFLDVTGLERVTGTPRQIAARLRRDARDRVGLAVTVGGGTTKLVAKTASGTAKPDGLLVVPPEEELAFLRRLPVERVWGIGPATTRRLNACGVRLVGDVVGVQETDLVAMLGPAAGRFVHGVARNRDRRRVAARPRRGSFGSQSAGRRSPDAVDEVLLGLADRVAYRMRTSSRRGRTVTIRLRFDDFTRATRSLTLRRPTSATREILAAARQLFAETRPLVLERGLTLVGVAVSNLDDRFAPFQLALPVDDPAVAGLDAAVDAVRERFGAKAITFGTLLHRDLRSMPWVADED